MLELCDDIKRYTQLLLKMKMPIFVIYILNYLIITIIIYYLLCLLKEEAKNKNPVKASSMAVVKKHVLYCKLNNVDHKTTKAATKVLAVAMVAAVSNSLSTLL